MEYSICMQLKKKKKYQFKNMTKGKNLIMIYELKEEKK